MNKFFILLIQYEIIFEILSQHIPQLVNIFGRKKISLNGKWNYIVDIQDSGYYDYRLNISDNGFFMNEKPKNPDDLVEYVIPLIHKKKLYYILVLLIMSQLYI